MAKNNRLIIKQTIKTSKKTHSGMPLNNVIIEYDDGCMQRFTNVLITHMFTNNGAPISIEFLMTPYTRVYEANKQEKNIFKNY